jgi:hypothetical protein
MTLKMKEMTFDIFTILHFNTYYIIQKECSITKEIYRVKLSNEEFMKYYTPKGKIVKHLDRLNKEEKLFLKTTLTPEEIKLLSTNEKEKLSKKIWRFRIPKP